MSTFGHHIDINKKKKKKKMRHSHIKELECFTERSMLLRQMDGKRRGRHQNKQWKCCSGKRLRACKPRRDGFYFLLFLLKLKMTFSRYSTDNSGAYRDFFTYIYIYLFKYWHHCSLLPLLYSNGRERERNFMTLRCFSFSLFSYYKTQ